jgi:predicted peptidase
MKKIPWIIVSRKALLLAFLLMGLFVSGQYSAGNPCTTSRKTAGRNWTNAIPWQRETIANDVIGMIDLHNYVDSQTLSNTLQKISSGGGGVLFFRSGTYYFNNNLLLYDRVVIRGADPEPGSLSSQLTTHLVFPRLILNRGGNPKSDEPVCYAPKRIATASSVTSFTGLVNLDINRAVIRIGASGGVNDVLLYQVRQNNALLLDKRVPTALQVSERQGWQIWPDKEEPNIRIVFSKHCLVTGCTLNDSTTDNIVQSDYMTEDRMRFDGSLARVRCTAHNVLEILRDPGKGKTDPGKGKTGGGPGSEITGNTVYYSVGFQPFVLPSGGLLPGSNKQTPIQEPSNLVIDGVTSARDDYNILYNDKYPSEARIFYSSYGDSLPYRLIKPDNYDSTKKYPLVIFLHDFWEKGVDSKRHLRQFIWQLVTDENRRKFPCFILAPQLPSSEPKWKCEGLGSDTWPLQCVNLLTDELVARLPIDSRRIYAVGNSMGAAGAFNFAIQYPDKPAAVLTVSMFYVLTRNAALEIAHIPTWLIYGAADERIRPQVRLSLRTDLKLAHADFRYTEIPGMGHRCWNQVEKEVPDVFSWMFNQRKADTGSLPNPGNTAAANVPSR